MAFINFLKVEYHTGREGGGDHMKLELSNEVLIMGMRMRRKCNIVIFDIHHHHHQDLHRFGTGLQQVVSHLLKQPLSDYYHLHALKTCLIHASKRLVEICYEAPASTLSAQTQVFLTLNKISS